MKQPTWTSVKTFGADGWRRLIDNTNRWWAGELNRPLIAARIQLPHDHCPTTGLPYHGIVAQYPFEVPMDDILQTWDWHLQHQRFLGDAYPAIWADFGASFISALAGGQLTPAPAEETTWIHRMPGVTIDRLHYQLDSDNPWHRRYESFCQAASEYWQGSVQIGFATGGLLDSISALIGAEEFLLALMDEPAEVRRVIAEVEALSWHYYHLVQGYLSRSNPGYSCWAHIFSEKPYQMLICDVCGSFGPRIFESFVQPSLETSCQHTTHSVYHLDGPGALVHLDALLSMKALSGIQWVPGAGEPRPWDEWAPVIRRILDAGKRVQLSSRCQVAQMQEIDRLMQSLGTGKGITINLYGEERDARKMEQFLERYGVV